LVFSVVVFSVYLDVIRLTHAHSVFSADTLEDYPDLSESWELINKDMLSKMLRLLRSFTRNVTGGRVYNEKVVFYIRSLEVVVFF
jgi:hypothetical protein